MSVFIPTLPVLGAMEMTGTTIKPTTGAAADWVTEPAARTSWDPAVEGGTAKVAVHVPWPLAVMAEATGVPP
jgi:hypothetical protein